MEEVDQDALADELAYATATELAGRIRRREDTYQPCASRPLKWRPTDPQEPRLKSNSDQLVGERIASPEENR
jgi:hypothetical protein